MKISSPSPSPRGPLKSADSPLVYNTFNTLSASNADSSEFTLSSSNFTDPSSRLESFDDDCFLNSNSIIYYVGCFLYSASIISGISFLLLYIIHINSYIPTSLILSLAILSWFLNFIFATLSLIYFHKNTF